MAGPDHSWESWGGIILQAPHAGPVEESWGSCGCLLHLSARTQPAMPEAGAHGDFTPHNSHRVTGPGSDQRATLLSCLQLLRCFTTLREGGCRSRSMSTQQPWHFSLGTQHTGHSTSMQELPSSFSIEAGTVISRSIPAGQMQSEGPDPTQGGLHEGAYAAPRPASCFNPGPLHW